MMEEYENGYGYSKNYNTNNNKKTNFKKRNWVEKKDNYDNINGNNYHQNTNDYNKNESKYDSKHNRGIKNDDNGYYFNYKKDNNLYLGNAKEKRRKDSGDPFIVGTMCIDTINNIPSKHIIIGKDGKKYFRFCINPYKNGMNQHGNTHSCSVDIHPQELKTYKENDSKLV